MEKLFILDRQDYTSDMPVYERFCVRGLIRRNGMLMVQKSSIGEYKLPGGGVENEEDMLLALQREVLEETGLTIIMDSLEEIGEVLEKRADVFDRDRIYLNHTYYYSCDAYEGQSELDLTPEELAKGYTAVWERPERIIQENEAIQKNYWRRRDTLFLKWFINDAASRTASED